jgi:hypothetical protein
MALPAAGLENPEQNALPLVDEKANLVVLPDSSRILIVAPMASDVDKCSNRNNVKQDQMIR